MNEYWMLRLIGRHGDWIAAGFALLALAAAIWVVALGWSSWWLAIGVIGAGIIFGAVRSYVEMVRLMIDMLLPK